VLVRLGWPQFGCSLSLGREFKGGFRGCCFTWLLQVVDLGRIGLSSTWLFLVLIAFFIRDFIAIYVLLLDFV
jgi:hypothetical protein